MLWSIEKLKGPFSIQSNNTTRQYEYPWAFEVAKIKSGMRVLEVGGSLCGFQFVLSRLGCPTINIDPGMAATGVGWPCDQVSMNKLNQIFGTDVELRNTTIDKAGLADDSLDCAFSISVIEHLPSPEARNIMEHVYRCLKPGGLFVLTIDLFLNLHPFSSRTANEFGKNQDIRWLVEIENWELQVGDSTKLFGFSDFNPDAILSNLDQYLIGNYPTLVQCLVLKKPLG